MIIEIIVLALAVGISSFAVYYGIMLRIKIK